MGPTGATLSGSFTGATGRIYEAGFEYAASHSGLDGTGNTSTFVYDDSCVGSVSSGSIRATIGSLDPSKTYYYRAFVSEYNESTKSYEYRFGNVVSFTTNPAAAYIPSGWLELPVVTNNEDFVGKFYGSGDVLGTNRNYSYNYSYEYFGCLWVAYPLTYSHTVGSVSSDWSLNPKVSDNKQVNNMFTNSYPSNYEDANDYSKGHQIPNADRYSDATMNAQTYYMTNQTPQLSNAFNNSVWGSLENAVRSLVSSSSADSVYVVTGACYKTVGGNETVKTLIAKSSSLVTPKSISIPNYYWKVLLKVTWEEGMVTNATAIGFWMPHEDLRGKSYTSFACSVDDIERYTGFDFFTNLPGNNSSGIEKKAEANTSWDTFRNF